MKIHLILIIVIIILVILYLIPFISYQFYYPINHKIEKILVGIVTTDDRKDYIDQVYNGIENLKDYFKTVEIMVICRETDHISQKEWKNKNANVLTIPYYEMFKENESDRHNMTKIAEKRNLVLQNAKDYDGVLFVDSDIIIDQQNAKELKEITNFADIVVGVYQTPWSSPFCPVGKFNIPFPHELLKLFDYYPSIQCGGMGCTLISRKFIDIVFGVSSFGGVTGEDIDFFIKAIKRNAVIKSTRTPLKHLNLNRGNHNLYSLFDSFMASSNKIPDN